MAMAKTQFLTRPTRLDGMTPAEVAAGLRHLPNLVFFDTAGNIPSSAGRPISVIAARPTKILRGSIHVVSDRAMLRHALTASQTMAGDTGFPLGGLCGWCFAMTAKLGGKPENFLRNFGYPPKLRLKSAPSKP